MPGEAQGLDFIPAPPAGTGLTSAGRCGSRAAAPSAGMPSAGARSVLLAAQVFSLRLRFDLELYVLVFTVLIPSWAATVKSWLRLHHQPSVKRFKSQARSRERGLVPADPGAAHVGPAPAIWPCAFAGNFGLFLFLIFPFLPLFEQLEWSCG